jgi:hypothetical protein
VVAERALSDRREDIPLSDRERAEGFQRLLSITVADERD